jgi:hypothetical protein
MALARAVSEERIMVARPLSPPSDLALNPMAAHSRNRLPYLAT